MGRKILASKRNGILHLLGAAVRGPSHLSGKAAAVHMILPVLLVFAVAFAEMLIRHFFPTSYVYLYVAPYSIAAAIGIVYARERFYLSRVNVPFVLSAVPISVTMFYVGIWLTGPAVVTLGDNVRSVYLSICHFLLVCFLIPLFEEIVTRSLFFIGLAKYIGYLPAAIITSVLFAIAHPQMPPAFIVSCILCYMTYRGVLRSLRHTNLIARTLFHSTYNIVVIGLTFYNALGSF